LRQAIITDVQCAEAPNKSHDSTVRCAFREREKPLQSAGSPLASNTRITVNDVSPHDDSRLALGAAFDLDRL
jgi:hypothetical protein